MSDTEPALVGVPPRRHAAVRQHRPANRRTPAKGVHISLGEPNWIFLTVCTEKRECWLAQASVQRALHEIMDAGRMTSALAPALSPGEGESFAAPLKIYTTGSAGRSSAKQETTESYFLSWGRG